MIDGYHRRFPGVFSSLLCLCEWNERTIPVAEVEQARQIKAWHPDYALIGERNGRKLPGFDYGNSP
jgi:phosphosulfolactate phosphohydrolase-like enzyme